MDIASHPHSDPLTTGEIRTLIKEIQDYLSAPDQTESEDMQERWRQYCFVCQFLNQRLDRTDQFLERGEWLEAVRSAELDPPILESVGIIDFDGREAWEQLGTDLGWERLIPVSMESCERLNEAWENRRRLKPLLRQHIRLAVCGEEFLGERLTVMRELYRRDKFSTFWRDDIQKLERVHVPQLIHRLKQARKDRDIPTARAILHELQQTEWTLKLTSGMQEQVLAAEADLLETADIPELSAILIQAMQQNDHATACDCLHTWQGFVARFYELQPDPGIQIQNIIANTQAAEQWASVAYHQQTCLQQLESLAAQTMPRSGQIPADQLRRQADQAEQLNAQLPPELQRPDLVTKVQSAHQRAKRMAMVNTALTAAAVVVGIGVVGFVLVIAGRFLAGSN